MASVLSRLIARAGFARATNQYPLKLALPYRASAPHTMGAGIGSAGVAAINAAGLSGVGVPSTSWPTTSVGSGRIILDALEPADAIQLSFYLRQWDDTGDVAVGSLAAFLSIYRVQQMLGANGGLEYVQEYMGKISVSCSGSAPNAYSADSGGLLPALTSWCDTITVVEDLSLSPGIRVIGGGATPGYAKASVVVDQMGSAAIGVYAYASTGDGEGDNNVAGVGVAYSYL